MNGFHSLESLSPPITAAPKGDTLLSEVVAGNLEVSPVSNLKKREDNMNRTNAHEVIISGIHLDLTPSLKTYVTEKTERLFRHEERIMRIRVELECDSKASVDSRFKAKGHMTINGPELTATVASDECHKAISLLTDKLDRMLRRRARLFKEKRNHPHGIELPDVELPKLQLAGT